MWSSAASRLCCTVRVRLFHVQAMLGTTCLGYGGRAGLSLSDLSGYRALFLRFWSTSLRYTHELPEGVDAQTLLRGGRELVGMVAVRIRHAGRRPRVRKAGAE
jgi:hypothetical protein